MLSGFTLIHAEHQRVNSVNIPLFFSSITSSQSEHSLNLYSTQVTMWPFTGPDTEHADTFLSHRFRRQKDPSRFFFFVFCFCFFCFFLLSFSTRSSSSCCLWGGRKKARFCSLYALHTRSITAAIKSRSEHLSAPPERRTQQNACAVCVCFLTRQMSSMVPDGQPFVAGSVCPPSVAARQPCGGTEWARRDWSGLRSPGHSAKSRESGANSHPPPRFCPHMLPLHTPTEGVSTQ